MEPTLELRHRLSSLARLCVVVVVGTLLVGAPMSEARAADDRSAALADDDALLTALGERLVATRRAAGERLRALVHETFTLTVQRMHEARQGMERVITFDHGLEQPASIDDEASAVAEHENDASSAAKREPERPRRLEYVEGSNDPLAGL